MRTKQSSTRNGQRVLRQILLGTLLLILTFLFGPPAIRAAHAFTTNSSEIAALKEHYRALDSTEHLLPAPQQQISARRRFEIAGWLAMRGVVIDAGIRGEAVEHGRFPSRFSASLGGRGPTSSAIGRFLRVSGHHSIYFPMFAHQLSQAARRRCHFPPRSPHSLSRFPETS